MKRLIPILLIFLALVSCGKQKDPVLEQHLDKGWNLSGDTLWFKEALTKVDLPWVVQQGIPHVHPYQGMVENELLWISDHEWYYQLAFTVNDELLEKDHVELVFEGIDTYADVILNGEKLFFADNMFRTWKTEVKHLLHKGNDNLLEVNFLSYDSTQMALYEQHHPQLPEKYAVTRKCGYQHGWDWAPKYKNVGLWKPVKLVAWSEARLDNAYVVTEALKEDGAEMVLHVDVETLADHDFKGEVELYVDGKKKDLGDQADIDRSGHFRVPFVVNHPRIWWPNEMGDQPLYDVEVVLKKDGKTLDSRHFHTGIKTLQIIQEPDEVGFSFYFKVNGQPMYAKGANYIPEQMIETWINHDQTLHLLEEAKSAHFNMLRVWGGGIYPAEDFFNICDSLGILVWEDFMYAGSMYPYDEAFLENATIEALEQVKRMASHPSLALWCGGNEISEGYYNWGWQQSLGWSEEDDLAVKAGYDRLFEEILPLVVDTYDGTRPYWPSSPSKGWGRPESLTQGDVHYWGVWWGELPFEMYREKVGRFNSEYGYQAYPDLVTLKEAAGDDPEFKALCEYQGDSLYQLIAENKFLAAHQKHARGARQIDDFIERYFPTPKTFDEYIYISQLSQAFGVGMAIEAHRVAKPYNMGTLYWQLNDAWPVTSWSTIDHEGRKKALQYQLHTLYAPVLLSLDPKDLSVGVTSDLLRSVEGKLMVAVKDFFGNQLFIQELDVDLAANQNKRCYVDGLSEQLAMVDPAQVYVKLELLEGETPLAERYCYLVYPKDLDFPENQIDMTISKARDHIVIDVRSEGFAKDVRLTAQPGKGSFSDNYFDLEPGVTRRVVFTPDDPAGLFVFSARSL